METGFSWVVVGFFGVAKELFFVKLELAVGEGGIGSAVVVLDHRVGEVGISVEGLRADPGLPAVDLLPDIEPLVSELRVVGAVLFLVSF